MAVALDTKYTVFGQPDKTLFGNIYVRMKKESFPYYRQSFTGSEWYWKILRTIQVKVTGRTIQNVTVRYRSDDAQPEGTVIARKLNTSISDKSDYYDIPLDNVTNSYFSFENHSIATFLKNEGQTNSVDTGYFDIEISGKNGKFDFTNNFTIESPLIPYGGISEWAPIYNAASDIVSTTTDATVYYRISAPYTTKLYATLYNGASITSPTIGTVLVDSNAGTDTEKSFTIQKAFDTSLQPRKVYRIDLSAQCDNEASTDKTLVIETKPITTTEIVAPSSVYVDENDVEMFNISILPSDASYKSVKIEPSRSPRYAFSINGTEYYDKPGGSVYGNKVYVKGKSASFTPDVLHLKTYDGSYITKDVDVYICRPATQIIPSTTDRKIITESTYKLGYTILPEGSTDAVDSNVSFSSANTSIATVDNTGLITAVSAGQTTVTITLQRRAKEPITAVVTVRVSALREWIRIPVSDHLTYNTIDDVFNNLSYMKAVLEDQKEVPVGTLNEPQTGLGNLIPLYSTRDIINDIESDIDILYEATKNMTDTNGFLAKAKAEYSAPVEWIGTIWHVDASNRFMRWILWMQNMYNFLEPEKITLPPVAVTDDDDNVTAYIYIDEYGNETTIPVNEVDEL